MNKHPQQFFFANSYVAGLVTALAIFVFCNSEKAVGFIYEWQNLVAATAASIAAAAAISATHRQINQNQEIEETRRLRRNLASRSLIASSLKNVVEVEEKILGMLCMHFSSSIAQGVFSGTLDQHRVVDRDYDLLARCIEDAEPKAAADLAQLHFDLQIQQSRLHSVGRDDYSTKQITTANNLREYAMDAILIQARALRLFHYARMQDEIYYSTNMRQVVLTSIWKQIDHFDISQLAQERTDRPGNDWLLPRLPLDRP